MQIIIDVSEALICEVPCNQDPASISCCVHQSCLNIDNDCAPPLMYLNSFTTFCLPSDDTLFPPSIIPRIASQSLTSLPSISAMTCCPWACFGQYFGLKCCCSIYSNYDQLNTLKTQCCKLGCLVSSRVQLPPHRLLYSLGE